MTSDLDPGRGHGQGQRSSVFGLPVGRRGRWRSRGQQRGQAKLVEEQGQGRRGQQTKQLQFMHHFILLALSFLVLIRAKNPLKSVNALS